jgi:hypothetical protein
MTMDNKSNAELLAEWKAQRGEELEVERQAAVDARWESERMTRRHSYIEHGGDADTFDRTWNETKHRLIQEEEEEAYKDSLSRVHRPF